MKRFPFLAVFLFALGALSAKGRGAEQRSITQDSGVRPSSTHQPARNNQSTTSAPWWQQAGCPELTRLITQALSGNRELRGAFARLEKARALREEQSAGFLPTMNLFAGFRRQLDSTVFFQGVPRSTRDQNIVEVGIESAWEIDLFGRVRHSVEAAGALSGAAEADLAQVRQLVVAETARAYTELTTVQAAIPLQMRVIAAAQEFRRVLCEQVGEGKISADKIGPADAAVTTAQQLLSDLAVSQRSARNRLAVLTGNGSLPVLNTHSIPRFPAPELPSDVSRVLARRPDVQAAERRLAASRAAAGMARAAYFPTVSLVGRLGAETNQPGNLGAADANSFAFGPRLQWDLLNLRRTVSHVQGAKAQGSQALAAWEDSVLLALEEVDNALALRGECLGKVRVWERGTAAMEEAVRIAQLKAAEGRIAPAEVLGVEQGALQAQIARVRAEGELANATILLQKACAFHP
ncbi:MAG: hypothetical protein RLZZ399_543 [Verrucomicrobiota bacterium]|jgi:NodT family efflux transporter outer membrane factor (OMF) lipoprotein